MVNEDNVDGLWSRITNPLHTNPRILELIFLLLMFLSETMNELFDGIIGHNDVKKIFKLSLSSDIPVHILLVHAPPQRKLSLC